jgi:DNA-binding SARP family transcriptional activator
MVDESEIAAFADHFVFTYKADQQEPLYLVKASLFGTPEISANGVRIPDTEWKTKKVKALLEYLLFNSGNTVSKEQLAELLWPEADSRAATASLRTALYHLRKILSKYQVEVAGKNAFLQETLEGLQIRKNAALELDVHEFLRLCHECSLLAKQAPQTDQRSAELLKRMIELYKGDLMEGGDYGDAIFHERERLKTIFIESCQKLSGIYTEQAELQQAEEILRRAFAAEPYDEAICLKLLELYMAQGRKSKAVKLYYSFKKRLEQELDVKIDKRLTEAIR